MDPQEDRLTGLLPSMASQIDIAAAGLDLVRQVSVPARGALVITTAAFGVVYHRWSVAAFGAPYPGD